MPKPTLIFTHGINNGPDERPTILPRLEGYLTKYGIRDCFGDVSVAQWNSTGNFLKDLAELAFPEKQQEAINQVKQEYSKVQGSVLAVGHSMGQILTVMALKDMNVNASLLTLGGPMGNPWSRPYFEWVPDNLWRDEPSKTMHVREWVDVYNYDDPIPGAICYRPFIAKSERISYPGIPFPNPLAEHGSYFNSQKVFDIAKELALRI